MGNLQKKPLSEYISEEGISEHAGENGNSLRKPVHNPKEYECFIHGKAVDFDGPFCVECHPEARAEKIWPANRKSGALKA